MPSAAISLHTQLQRHLGHRVEDLPIHNDVGHALSSLWRRDGFWQTPSFRTDTMRGVCIAICCASCNIAPKSTRHINIRCESFIVLQHAAQCPDRCRDGRQKPYRACTNDNPGLRGTQKPRNTFSTPQHSTPQQHIPPGPGMNGTTTSGTHFRSVGNASENGMKVRSNG